MMMSCSDSLRQFGRSTLVWVVWVIAAGSCWGQTVVTGSVQGATEPLAYAQVTVPAQQSGVLTNTDGVFQIPVTQFPATVVVRMLGYRADTLPLREAPVGPLRITLREQAIHLAEVAIRSDQNYGYELAKLALARMQDTLSETSAPEAGIYRMFAWDSGQPIEVQEIFLGSGIKPHINRYQRTLTGRFGRLPKDSIRGLGAQFNNFSRLTFLPYALTPVKRLVTPLSVLGLDAFDYKFEGFVQQDGRTLGLVQFVRKPKGKGEGYRNGRMYVDNATGDLFALDGHLMEMVSGGMFMDEDDSQLHVRHVFAAGRDGRTRLTQYESSLRINYNRLGKRGTVTVETIYYVLPQLPQQLVAQVPTQAKMLSKQEQKAGSNERRMVASSTYLPDFWRYAAQIIQPTAAQTAILRDFEQRNYFLQPQ